MIKQEYTSKLTGEVLPFQTRYSYVNDKSEKNDKPSDTDATLFVPLKTMINRIVQGDISEILKASLEVPFDDSDAYELPSDASGYDLADAFEDSMDIIENSKQMNQENKADNSPAPETKVSEATETESNAAQ